jgi:hypothetical protein
MGNWSDSGAVLIERKGCTASAVNLFEAKCLASLEMLYFIQPRTAIYSLSFRRLLRGGDELLEDDVEICSI